MVALAAPDHPIERQTMKVQQSRKSGFTLVEIMIVVAIIGLLAAVILG